MEAFLVVFILGFVMGAALSSAVASREIVGLQKQLTKAQANDNRDPKSGRFVRAS